MDSDNTRTIPFPPFIPGAGRGEAGEGEPAPGWKSGGGGKEERGRRRRRRRDEGEKRRAHRPRGRLTGIDRALRYARYECFMQYLSRKQRDNS